MHPGTALTLILRVEGIPYDSAEVRVLLLFPDGKGILHTVPRGGRGRGDVTTGPRATWGFVERVEGLAPGSYSVGFAEADPRFPTAPVRFVLDGAETPHLVVLAAQ